LRQRFRLFRAGLTETDYVVRSAALVAQAGMLPELRQAATVHTYWPSVARREIDIRPLIDQLRRSGKQIVLPVVDIRVETPRLRHVRYEAAATLRPNRWGMDEPTGNKSVPLETIDVVITPALGAGRNGHRLGYGKGYYDAFLRALDVPTVCLLYAECLIPWMPAASHDVPIDVLITEDEVIRRQPGVTSLPPPS